MTLLTGFVFGFAIAMFFCIITGESNWKWHQEVVSHGAAHYNATNQNFEWNKGFMCQKCSKPVLDGKGHLIGREVNGILLDGKGHNIARYNESSNRTLDGKGKNLGVGDQRQKQLGK